MYNFVSKLATTNEFPGFKALHSIIILTFLTTLTLKSRPLRLPIPRKVPGMISRIKLRLKLMYSKEARACRSTSFMV